MESRMPPEISLRASVEMLETRVVKSLPPSQVSIPTNTTAKAPTPMAIRIFFFCRNRTAAKTISSIKIAIMPPREPDEKHRSYHHRRGNARSGAFLLACQLCQG